MGYRFAKHGGANHVEGVSARERERGDKAQILDDKLKNEPEKGG
jgi:hypothetical protein